MDRILITGADGGLGKVLKKELAKRYEVIAVNRAVMNITDQVAVDSVIREAKPTSVFHCAAFSDVDLAQKEKHQAYAANVRGTENVARACRRYGAALIFISSDYVFDGYLDRPYSEDDLVEPINYYGVTKVLGEQIVRDLLERYYIVRCSWLFGPAGHTFLQKIIQKASDSEIRVVGDQIGSPTYTPDLAKALSELAAIEQWGTYHVTNEGYCSWAEYAQEIIRLVGSGTIVTAVSSSEYQTPAQRPLNSRLSKEKLYSRGIHPLPHWKDALGDYFQHGSYGDRYGGSLTGEL